MKAAIFPNFQKRNALECAREICDILHSIGAEVHIDESYLKEFSDKKFVQFGLFDNFVGNADIAVAIGGDGTILKCAKHIVSCNTKLLGVNTGRLGFMASLEYDQLGLLECLKTGSYNVSERMMLEISMDNQSRSFHALNDVTISGRYAKICEFDVFADSSHIGKYRADGAVFSTPTGSTAYSLSAGGPIIEPDAECIEMTLICPHSLFARPIIFSSDRVIEFVHDSDRNPELFVSIDGNDPIKLERGVRVSIKKSGLKISLINIDGRSFYNTLDRKLMHPIK